MESIALGFSNTVDYEMIWSSAHIERLIRELSIHKDDIRELNEINSLRDMVTIVLYHFSKGTGCGIAFRDNDILLDFIKGTQGKTMLGGTNVRAADVIDALGGESLLHLVSINPETIERLPASARIIGGDDYHCAYPHLALQFPAGAEIHSGDIDLRCPRPNRVLFTADVACAMMPISEEFLSEAEKSDILVMSSFDLMPDRDIIRARLDKILQCMGRWEGVKPTVYYEHGGFANKSSEKTVIDALAPVSDIFSMNEDELSGLYGGEITLLDADSVAKAFTAVRKRLNSRTLIVHSRYWVIAQGNVTEQIEKAIQSGIDVSATRYRCGCVTPELLAETQRMPKQQKAFPFAGQIEKTLHECRCFPTYELSSDNATTVGLGDSFVGGFVYAFSRFDKSNC